MMNNEKAFLDMIATSELGAALLKVSDNGYNVLVGSTPSHPLLFHDYSTHPNVLNRALDSTAAGRYQLLHRFYVAYARSLNLPDFSPASQDAIALQQVRECRAHDLVVAGNFDMAVARCAHIWASLPGSGYGQHENKIEDLRVAYRAAGGVFA